MNLLYADKLRFESMMSYLFNDKLVDGDASLGKTGYKFISVNDSLFSTGCRVYVPYKDFFLDKPKEEEEDKGKRFVISNGKLKILFSRKKDNRVKLEGVVIRYLNDKGVFRSHAVPWEEDDVYKRFVYGNKRKGRYEYDVSLRKHSHDQEVNIVEDENGKLKKVSPSLLVEDNLKEVVSEIREYANFSPDWLDEGPWWAEFKNFVETLDLVLRESESDEQTEAREARRMQVERARSAFNV